MSPLLLVALAHVTVAAGHRVAEPTELIGGRLYRAPGGHRASPWVQRGDWEPPDALLVAHTAAWRREIAAIVRAANGDTPVYLLVDPDEPMTHFLLAGEREAMHAPELLFVDHDTPWVRDFGPLQVRDRSGVWQWRDAFYSPERPRDDRVPAALAMHLGVEVHQVSSTLDGGALISNGRGLCVTTWRALLETGVDTESDAAMATLQRDTACPTLGVVRDLPLEPTGHADVMAQFLSPTVVVVGMANPRDAPAAAAALDDAARFLEEVSGLQGQPLEVVRIPMVVKEGIFYSYVNATRLQHALLVPSYDSVPIDVQQDALERLAEALPNVTLAPIPADAMARLGGAVHCVALGLNVPVRFAAREHGQRSTP